MRLNEFGKEDTLSGKLIKAWANSSPGLYLYQCPPGLFQHLIKINGFIEKRGKEDYYLVWVSLWREWSKNHHWVVTAKAEWIWDSYRIKHKLLKFYTTLEWKISLDNDGYESNQVWIWVNSNSIWHEKSQIRAQTQAQWILKDMSSNSICMGSIL